MTVVSDQKPQNDLADDHYQELINRAGLYQFFSSIFLREMDLGFLALMRQMQFANALGDLSIKVPEPTDTNIESLAIDYCRIFIGPKDHVPPFQSVWLDGQLQSECTASMTEYLEIAPLDLAKNQINDHFGLQLAVMARILQATGNSVAQNENEQASEYARLATAFFIEHIAWAKRMLAAAASRSPSDFYRTLLQACSDFLSDEETRLTVDEHDLDQTAS